MNPFLSRKENFGEKRQKLSAFEKKLLEEAKHYKEAEQMEEVNLVRNLQKKEKAKNKKTRNVVDVRRPSTLDISELLSGKQSVESFNEFH